jgi:hypothetical protein
VFVERLVVEAVKQEQATGWSWLRRHRTVQAVRKSQIRYIQLFTSGLLLLSPDIPSATSLPLSPPPCHTLIKHSANIFLILSQKRDYLLSRHSLWDTIKQLKPSERKAIELSEQMQERLQQEIDLLYTQCVVDVSIAIVQPRLAFPI